MVFKTFVFYVKKVQSFTKKGLLALHMLYIGIVSKTHAHFSHKKNRLKGVAVKDSMKLAAALGPLPKGGWISP